MRSFILTFFLFICACSSKNTNNAPVVVSNIEERQAVVENVANLTSERITDFAIKATDLNASVAQLDANQLQTAHVPFYDALSRWQRLEVMQYGPAAITDSQPGALGLRDEIYSWPVSNSCRIDQELTGELFQDPATFAGLAPNVRGLDAIEYLLFVADETNTCPLQATINTDGSWEAIIPDLPARRLTFLKNATADLVAQADALQNAWANGYLDDLKGAGKNGQSFPSVQDALNQISNALFYIDKELKDQKLAIPAGLAECATDTCPDRRETPYANRSYSTARQNLLGLQAIYTGDDGMGFDDLLVTIGASELDAKIKTAIDDALAAFPVDDVDMLDDLTADANLVFLRYEKIKIITDLLKTEFLSVLDLELPQRADGDND